MPSQVLRVMSYNIQVGISTKRPHHYLTHSWKHILPHTQRLTNLDRVARLMADFDIVGLEVEIKPWNLELFGFFELDALRKDTTPNWPSLPISFSTEKFAMQRMNVGLYYWRNYG